MIYAINDLRAALSSAGVAFPLSNSFINSYRRVSSSGFGSGFFCFALSFSRSTVLAYVAINSNSCYFVSIRLIS